MNIVNPNPNDDCFEHPLFPWLTLWRLPQLGSRCFFKLLDAFPDLNSVFKASPQRLLSLGLNQEQQESLIGLTSTVEGERILVGVRQDLDWLQSDDSHHLLTFNDSRFPPLLKLIANPPPLLFVKGNPKVLSQPQVAVVGSRNASRQALETTRSFCRGLCDAGVVVTSGLALGVDGQAHQGAVDKQGHTIAVVAHGLDKLYPKRHQRLAQQIVEMGGVIVSEFPIGVAPKPNYFPRRNRIISGLSLGVLVVEAALQSGSLITAREAVEQGREVFAMPGSIHNPMARGCHELIRQGAKLVESVEHVLEELNSLWQLSFELNGAQQSDEPATDDLFADIPLTPDEQSLLALLDLDTPLTLDDLVDRLGFSTSAVASLITLLEMKELIHVGHFGYLKRS